MNPEIKFSEVYSSNIRRVEKIKVFLENLGLELPSGMDIFVTAKDHDELIAVGGLSGKILKGIAVLPQRRGEGIILALMTGLINIAYERNQKDLFLFSTPNNQALFEGCGFHLIQKYKNSVILMENNQNIHKYKQSLKSQKQNGRTIGSIVMNANPFTLGHQYLAEQASRACDWLHLFVVREDASEFKFKDRLELVKQGVAHIKNVTIHEGSDYIISKTTFPTYFIKDKRKIDATYAQLDLSLFRDHIAPVLGITHRFVGTEPYCVVTDNYNQNMKKVLEDERSQSDPIEVIEVPRCQHHSLPISASRVRQLLCDNNLELLKELVPKSTFEFLNTNRRIHE
ncbi:[citrate (pro-3S)-lyase] ligase [Sulfurospirillum sp. 1612]|uniref:[citrate (pro-3S)-lyase] ligase n=1 Tax=Sulfurospirillum sp. 1612 TaxID=3094835 RepID=UPI002F921D7B